MSAAVEEKTKIRCPECGAAFMVRVAKLPKHVKSLTCSQCQGQIPLLDRVLPTPAQATEATDATHNDSVQHSADTSHDDWMNDLPELSSEHPAEPASEEEDSGWLAIYGDMMSILLLFFVLLFAISNVDKYKFELAMGSISSALGGPGAAMFAAPQTNSNAIVLSEGQKDQAMNDLLDSMSKERRQIRETQEALRRLIQNYDLSSEFELLNEPDALVIVARDAAMFDSGSAELNPRYVNALWEIAHTLNQQPNKVVIEGHTDSVPISTMRYPSNWELSTARATTIVRLFLDKAKFNPRNIASSGVAYFRPRYPEYGDKAKFNRRIEIRVQKRYPTEILGSAAPQSQ